MIVGQSAAAALALCVRAGARCDSVHDLDVGALQARLRALGQILHEDEEVDDAGSTHC